MRKAFLELLKGKEKNEFLNWFLAFLLGSGLSIVAFVMMIPFLQEASDFSYDQKADIGQMNMWRIVVLYAIFSVIISILSYPVSKLRRASIIVWIFWGLGTFLVVGITLSSQDYVGMSNNEQSIGEKIKEEQLHDAMMRIDSLEQEKEELERENQTQNKQETVYIPREVEEEIIECDTDLYDVRATEDECERVIVLEERTKDKLDDVLEEQDECGNKAIDQLDEDALDDCFKNAEDKRDDLIDELGEAIDKIIK